MLRLINVSIALMLLVGWPVSHAWGQTGPPGGVTFRDVNFQLPGDGWQHVESPATAGVAPAATSFTRAQDMAQVRGAHRQELADTSHTIAGLADDFSNADAGVLPNSPPNPPTFQRGYVDGEYMVRVENTEVVANVPTKDEYADATIAVDAHTADDTPQAAVWLYCRRFGSVPSGYRFRVEPATQRFAMDRVDKAQATPLVSFQTADVINSGSDVNHLELTCAGSTIAGSINGQTVFSVQEPTYSQGTMNIGASGPPDGAGEIRFANFAVLQG